MNSKDNQGPRTTFHMEALYSRKQMVQWLLGKGMVPRVKDNEGKTVMDFAGQNDQQDMLELLERWKAKQPVLRRKGCRSILEQT